MYLSGFLVEESHTLSSQIRRSWNPALCDDSRDRRQGDLSGYPGPERLRHSHPHPGLAVAGERCLWILSREYGIAMADIAKKLGGCTSAIARQFGKRRGRIKGINFSLRPPRPLISYRIFQRRFLTVIAFLSQCLFRTFFQYTLLIPTTPG